VADGAAITVKGWRAFLLEIEVTIEALTPLHIGSGQALDAALDAPLLRDLDGRPYIPGASIRGVWRHWLQGECELLGCDRDQFDSLFGSDANAALGRLMVGDAVLSGAASAEVRDHVRIDAKTGAAAEGAKFDSEVLAPGCAFTFHVAYEGDGPDDAELVLLSEGLRLIESGEMQVGGKGGWGWGRITSSAIRHHSFLRSTDEGLAEWFQARFGAETWTDGRPRINQNDKMAGLGPLGGRNALSTLDFQLRLHFDGPVLVKSALPPDPPEQEGQTTPDAVFVYTGAAKTKYLPGSSLRGVLREHACWIASVAKNEKLAVDLFGPQLYAGNAEAFRGVIQVFDGAIISGEEVYLDHVGIDRITAGAKDGAKFAFLALESPAIDVLVRLRLRWDQKAVLALWARVLRDLLRDSGEFWAGSGTSRGYGYLRRTELRSVRLDLVKGGPGEAPLTFAGAECGERPGRTIWNLTASAFADLTPLWNLAAGDWNPHVAYQGGR